MVLVYIFQISFLVKNQAESNQILHFLAHLDFARDGFRNKAIFYLLDYYIISNIFI